MPPPPKQTTTPLRDFLRDLLRKLESFSDGLFSLQQRVVDESLASKAPAVQQFVQKFGESAIPLVVREWHTRFRTHLEPEPPQESVLCAFGGEIEDNAISQEGLDAFIDWAEQQGNFNSQTAADKSTDPQVGQEVKDLNEAVAALLYFHCNPPGQKPVVRGSNLRGQLRQAVDELNKNGFVRSVLGGAPAIIVDVLAQLGLPRVNLYSMYHSNTIVALYQGQPVRLDVNTNPPQFICVNQAGMYQMGGSTFPHPTRSSYIFTYKRGHTIQLGNRSCTADRDDRVIFRIFRYIGDHQAQWDQVRIRLLQNGQATPWFMGPTVDSEEWPFSSGFVRWHVDNRALHIAYLDKTSIEQIRAYDYIILSAPGLAAFSQNTGSLLAYGETTSLLQQLTWISQGPAKIHLELSGEANPVQDRIQPFAEAMRGLIHSVGINDGELRQVTNLPDYTPPITVTGGACEVYQRYERALRLAQGLDLKRMYVHGNDVDLILRRGGTPGDLRAELHADLFAKGIVILAVLQRTLGDWRDYLEADYAIAVARDNIAAAANKLAQTTTLAPHERGPRRYAIGQARPALTTAEAAFQTRDFGTAQREAERARDIIARAFDIQEGPGSTTISLSPVLLAKGFQTLIEFAYDFTRFALGCNDPSSPSGLAPEGEQLFQRIVETGYHVMPEPDGYSVAVVPVMWPELPVELNPAGGGDICSGVSAVYAGF